MAEDSFLALPFVGPMGMSNWQEIGVRANSVDHVRIFSHFDHTNLVGVARDHDEQAEGRANKERRVLLPLFRTPTAIL